MSVRSSLVDICCDKRFKNKSDEELFVICRSYIPGPVFDEFCDAMNITHYKRDAFEKKIIELDNK